MATARRRSFASSRSADSIEAKYRRRFPGAVYFEVASGFRLLPQDCLGASDFNPWNIVQVRPRPEGARK
jgi:hypothetical protein